MYCTISRSRTILDFVCFSAIQNQCLLRASKMHPFPLQAWTSTRHSAADVSCRLNIIIDIDWGGASLELYGPAGVQRGPSGKWPMGSRSGSRISQVLRSYSGTWNGICSFEVSSCCNGCSRFRRAGLFALTLGLQKAEKKNLDIYLRRKQFGSNCCFSLHCKHFFL